jgi:hypothetical protein
MKLIRALALVTIVLGLVGSTTAEAATPSSGTLSKKSRMVKWSGSFTLMEPDPVGNCELGGSTDPICDHFMLKVNLPDGARVRVDLPVPNSATDMDLYIYNASGAEVGSSGNLPGNNEFVEFRHSARFTNKPYEVRVVPWIVAPGTTYTATAKVK